MLSHTVKNSSASHGTDRLKVDVDITHHHSESSPLTSELNIVDNSTQKLSIQESAFTRLTGGFLNRMWRCFQTSDNKYCSGSVSAEEETELTEILTQGKILRQQAHSLTASSYQSPTPQVWKGSRLKRCLVGAGLLTGSGVMGGAGYAGYQYYHTGTSSPGKSPQPRPPDTTPEVGGSLEGAFGYYDLHHDDPTNRTRYNRRHLSASAYNTAEPHLNNGKWRNNFHNTLKKANHRVINLLYREGLLLNKKSKYKEKMLYAVSQYLHYDEKTHTASVDKIKILAQKILSGRGIYGENKNEKLSSQQAKSVVRHWVFHNIIGTTPDKYVASKMKIDITRVYTVNDIHNLLSVDSLPAANRFQPDRLTQSEQSSLHIMWETSLLEDMPFLESSDKQIRSISLNDFEFANLYSGSRFIKNINGDNFSFEDLISIGESMWDLAIKEGISEGEIVYYRTPAILFNAVSPKEKPDISEDDIDIINNYLNHRKNIKLIEGDINEKYNTYLSAIKSWLTKGSLADKIIEECSNPKSDILNTNSIKRVAKQNYLDNFMKPCENAPDNLNDEYTQLTTHVADSFHKIDKYLILPALNTLSTDEQAFISAASSIIHLGKVLVNSSYIARLTQNGNPNKEINAPLNSTVIFSVQQNKQERIYALKETQNNQEYYKLTRVDRDLKNYLENDIFDNELINKFNPPRIFPDKLKYLYDLFFSVDHYTFNELFKIDKELIKTEQDNIKSLINSLSSNHRTTLFNDLYKVGNEYSDLQKVWHVVQHIIPFYDCSNSIIEKNIVASTFECTLDAISLIPLLGQAAKLSTKFGSGLTLGLYRGMNTLGKQGIKAAGKNILREVSLPTTVELASLGKETLRILDPGIEIMTSITSRKFGEKIVKWISSNKKNIDLAKNLDRIIAHLPHKKSAIQVIGILPGTKLEVPVTVIGKQKGKNIYVMKNPETGEKFGTKYFCLQNGIMTALSSSSASALMRNKPPAKNTHINQSININNLSRVKRTGNNPNLCSEQPSTSRANQASVNHYHKITNINSIAPRMEFLPPLITSPPAVKFIIKGNKRVRLEQPHLVDDTSPMGMHIKNIIARNYNENNLFVYHFDQDLETIPENLTRLKDNIPEYKEAVLLAKKIVDNLDNQFRLIEKQQMDGLLPSNLNLLKIENYLSKKMKLDTIVDTSTVSLIKKESINRLKYHVRNMKNYFDNEINNIYFVSANIDPLNYINASRKLVSFSLKNDEGRRVIIMADYFSLANIQTKLHTSILIEVSHFSGTYDVNINGHKAILESIENFHEAALGVNNQYIKPCEKFMNNYRDATHIDIDEDQLKELIKVDPVLRANIYIENSDFLVDIIADLATSVHHQ